MLSSPARQRGRAGRHERLLNILDKSRFGEGVNRSSDDEVIDNLHVESREHLLDVTGYRLIRGRWRGLA